VSRKCVPDSCCSLSSAALARLWIDPEREGTSTQGCQLARQGKAKQVGYPSLTVPRRASFLHSGDIPRVVGGVLRGRGRAGHTAIAIRWLRLLALTSLGLDRRSAGLTSTSRAPSLNPRRPTPPSSHQREYNLLSMRKTSVTKEKTGRKSSPVCHSEPGTLASWIIHITLRYIATIDDSSKRPCTLVKPHKSYPSQHPSLLTA
jgi:hypothetical protein